MKHLIFDVLIKIITFYLILNSMYLVVVLYEADLDFWPRVGCLVFMAAVQTPIFYLYRRQWKQSEMDVLREKLRNLSDGYTKKKG